ncbi:PH domain-containing protein [Halovenus rubra]|uniref:PH domain-containing protein n=2 Tax=Halovenus rubra TaxID=869890 RepID=A0ABD5XDC8_9EURY|nr:PH domain-containing protein [Halovenus rubra]
MTEGRDQRDDNQTKDERATGHNRSVKSGYGSQESGSGDTESRSPVLGEHPDATVDKTEHSGGAQPTQRDDDTHRATRHHQEQEETGASKVTIADREQNDGPWVDLGQFQPDETSVEGLPSGPRQEYLTDRRSLNPLVQIRWAIRVTVSALVFGLVVTWGLRTQGFTSQWGAGVVGVLLFAGLIWVILHYRRWVYQIRTDAIYLERGVVTHARTLVPYVRIQHVDTSRSPVERMLGLSTLVVYTAGSRGADISIPGLRPQDARDLQRRVKELAIEAKGDDAL